MVYIAFSVMELLVCRAFEDSRVSGFDAYRFTGIC